VQVSFSNAALTCIDIESGTRLSLEGVKDEVHLIWVILGYIYKLYFK